MTIRWGDNRGVQEFGVKGNLGVIWSCCSNMLKMLLCLHNLIDFDETWVKRSLARGSFGVFRHFWLQVILGFFKVTVDHWVFNLLKKCSHRVRLMWMLHIWSVHGLICIRGVLKFELGTDVQARSFDHHPITKPEKTQICDLCLNHLFREGSYFKPISTFLPFRLACMSTFWQPIR